MAEQYIYTMLGLNKSYGTKQVLKNINLCFYPGAKIGIVGENGSGKSTVLRIMAGLDQEFTGEAFITPGYTAGIVLQDPDLDKEITVREAVKSAFSETTAMLAEYDEVTAKMGEELSDEEMQKAMDRMGELQDKLDSSDAWNLDHQIEMASDALCLPDDDRIIGTLSGGEKRRVALCKALLEKPDLLLLDEPTNHLDAETIQWLEMQLREYPGTVIVVTHDRYFLDNITKWILELDNGSGIPWEGNYSSWLGQKITALAAKEKAGSPRARSLTRELDWIKMSNNERRELSRNRMIDYEKMVAKNNSSLGEGVVIQIAPGPDLGSQVLEFEKVAMGYNDTEVVNDVTFKMPRSAIVGLVGPNGSGKTTIMRLITGDLKPDEGEITIGSTVSLAYTDQERQALTGEIGLVEEIGGGAEEIELGPRKVPIRQYLSMFGFKGSDQQKSVDKLSGGEQNRANLAKVLKVGGNMLLLDEPTNDLDVNTLRMLEEAILEFKGCVLVISHDRFFLNRICTHLMVFEGEGKVHWFEGNFDDYLEWREKHGGKSLQDRRSRYKKLVKS
ncbi:MAG: energy-dependent translational throttle protein EttA [bacterium]|nr:energy-dependent translational throttle protein EttA [bacterium]